MKNLGEKKKQLNSLESTLVTIRRSKKSDDPLTLVPSPWRLMVTITGLFGLARDTSNRSIDNLP